MVGTIMLFKVSTIAFLRSTCFSVNTFLFSFMASPNLHSEKHFLPQGYEICNTL